MRRTFPAALAAVLMLLVPACGDAGEEVQSDPTAPVTSAESSTTTSTPPTTAATTTGPPPTNAPPVQTSLMLARDGLVVVPFGSNEQVVLDALTPDLGSPDSDEEAECPSGADQILRYENLTLVLSGGFFVGYLYDSPRGSELGLSLATEEGLELGAPESELRDMYPTVEIAESSLGTEFFAEFDRGSLGGLLSEPNGVVTTIWAGDNCAFR